MWCNLVNLQCLKLKVGGKIRERKRGESKKKKGRVEHFFFKSNFCEGKESAGYLTKLTLLKKGK